MAAALAPAAARAPAHVEATVIAGVQVFIAEPNAIPDQNRDKAVIHFHGGGLVLGAGECTSIFAKLEAVSRNCRVFAVDFRNPPDNPYPAALDDCIAVYSDLLSRFTHRKLVMTGSSGGGNLAVAAPLKMRETGIPLPAAIGLFTPEIDLTESGDTFQTNKEIDVVLPRGLPEFNALYANGHNLNTPYISPLFGDFATGFPPTFIQTGTRDLFLSNSVRLHLKLLQAGVDAQLVVGEAMPHGAFGGAPEDADLRVQFINFLAKRVGWAPSA